MSGEGMKGPRLSRREILAGAAAAALAAGPLAKAAEAAESLEASHEHPFGLQQVPDPHNVYAPAWEHLRSLMRKDKEELALGISPAAKKMQGILNEVRQKDTDFERIRTLKGQLQQSVPQVTIAQALSDFVKTWHSPLDSFKNPNDCKGYAALDYFGLGESGVAEKDRQMVILQHTYIDLEDPNKKEKNEYHAVVAARLGGKWHILDNMLHTVVPEDEFFVGNKTRNWAAIAALDDRGTWKILGKEKEHITRR